MDINQIFTEAGMRQTSSEWRDQHMEDARQYGQISDIIQSRLAQQHIDGDGRFSARRRARKVSKQVKRMAKASQKAAAAAEALYGSFVNEVVELPQRRELAEARRAERRQRRVAVAGGLVAKSLNKSTASLNGVPAEEFPQVSGIQQSAQPQYVDPVPFHVSVLDGSSTGHQALPNIHSFFDQEAM